MAYSDKFLRAIQFILPHEEDFARGHWGDENFVVAENVAGDSGGVTKYGIDQASHPGVDVANLTRDGAIALYWYEWGIDNMECLPEKLAICCFDVYVNGGHAIKWLQIALNVVHGDNRLPCLSNNLAVDGILGPETAAAANACDQISVAQYFIQERNDRFEAIATGPRAKFLAGWEQRDKDLEQFLAA